MDFWYAKARIKVKSDLQIEKENICLKSKVIRFGILNKKWKKIGRTENFVYTIGKRRLSFDIVTISDVTTGHLQNVWTSFLVIFGTYFFNYMIILNDYSREQL